MGKKAESQARLQQTAKVTQRHVYQGKFLQIRNDVLEESDGRRREWDIILHPGGVAILAITQAGDLVLVEQWRRAAGKIMLELPAGLLDPHEDPEECAQRELQEETGFKAQELAAFGGCFVAPGTSNEYIHLFLARNLTPSPLYADDTDEIDIRTVSLSEALQMINHHQISDAKTVLGILKYANYENCR